MVLHTELSWDAGLLNGFNLKIAAIEFNLREIGSIGSETYDNTSAKCLGGNVRLNSDVVVKDVELKT